MLDAATVLRHWTPAGPAHRRLDRLLRAAEPTQRLDDDTLGMRNQRLLRLMGAQAGALDAAASCPACGGANEFALPAEAVLALPPPRAQTVEAGGQVFRVPRMRDVLDETTTPLPERCRVAGEGPLAPDLVAEAGDKLEAVDPAADLAIDLVCADCGHAYRASIDIAAFAAAALDRRAARLYDEVDAIASAYGWSEDAILALPGDRRRRYVATIRARAGHLSGARP